MMLDLYGKSQIFWKKGISGVEFITLKYAILYVFQNNIIYHTPTPQLFLNLKYLQNLGVYQKVWKYYAPNDG
jgi:hypothetical protein